MNKSIGERWLPAQTLVSAFGIDSIVAVTFISSDLFGLIVKYGVEALANARLQCGLHPGTETEKLRSGTRTSRVEKFSKITIALARKMLFPW